MHITRLNIQRVRNLKTVALHELQPFNVFYGQNGSGKTSILEAIHLLATGRSLCGRCGPCDHASALRQILAQGAVRCGASEF